MNDPFSRRTCGIQGWEIRRLAWVGIGLILASLCWHAARPSLIVWLARSSVGCEARWWLLTEAVKGMHPTLARADHRRPVYTFSDSSRRGALWPGGSHPWMSFVLFDERLNLLGFVKSLNWPGVLFGDRDGDGRVEIEVTNYNPPRGRLTKPLATAVVRLGPSRNQLVGLFSLDRRGDVVGTWRDQDGDGIEELVIEIVVPRTTPLGLSYYVPSETVAVLEWDRPGGVLRPRQTSETKPVWFWTPIDNQPMDLPPGAELDTIIQGLLPADPPSSQPTGPQPLPGLADP